MKKIIILLTAAFAVLVSASCGSDNSAVELSFNYEKQPGPGSNQYAVWVENTEGEVVKTLFVTAYTTKGRAWGDEELVRGYIKRPNCVPEWVKRSNADSLSDEALDAFSGATPAESGLQSFVWDMTDASGNKVADGTYTIYVEATLYDSSIILYSGSFKTNGKAGEIVLSSSLTKEDESHAGMISDVKAVLR